MSTVALENRLKSLKNGKRQTIRGFEVLRNDAMYIVEDKEYTLQELTTYLSSIQADSGQDHGSIAYLEKKRYSDTILKIHRINSKAEHSLLAAQVRERGNYLWMARVVCTDGIYKALEPHVIDWDTVPDKEDEKKPVSASPSVLKCPYCSVVCTSSPGQTLHVKHAHPDRVNDFKREYRSK